LISEGFLASARTASRLPAFNASTRRWAVTAPTARGAINMARMMCRILYSRNLGSPPLKRGRTPFFATAVRKTPEKAATLRFSPSRGKWGTARFSDVALLYEQLAHAAGAVA